MLTLFLSAIFVFAFYCGSKNVKSEKYSYEPGWKVITSMVLSAVGFLCSLLIFTVGPSIVKQNDGNYALQLRGYMTKMMHQSVFEELGLDLSNIPWYIPTEHSFLLRRTLELKKVLDAYAEDSDLLSAVQLEQAQLVVAAGNRLRKEYLDVNWEKKHAQLVKTINTIGVNEPVTVAQK